ncbi:MAG: hypothetical protein HYU36_03940 [Planctomycetes bacterium]|nr:hypothetical protein [Planctomycetota bacterium]
MNLRNPFFPCLALLWRLPLGVLSFLVFKTAAWALRALLRTGLSRRRDLAHRWRPISRETFEQQLALPVLMTSAPRWNPHAIVAATGPLEVSRALTMDASAASRSARIWTLVVYTFPGGKTVRHIGSLDFEHGGGVLRMELNPGRYMLGLRYYAWSTVIEFPAIGNEGGEGVAALGADGTLNDFYAGWAGQNRGLYACLHYYVSVLLRYRRWLPRRLVEREFLPVGNPETRFHFGLILKGESVTFKLHEALLAHHEVYYTEYSRSSFPARWYRIEAAVHTTEPVDEMRLYLLRAHRTRAGGEAWDDRWVEVSGGS